MKKLLFAFALFSTPAAAAEFDFTQVIRDQDDVKVTECVDQECKNKKDITLGMIVFKALTSPEQGATLEESQRRGKLAMETYKAAKASLTAEDISLIKKQVAKIFGPLIVYRVVEILDPNGLNK